MREQRFEVGGVVVPRRTLVETPDGWVEPHPVFCLAGGHRLRPVLAGWVACIAPGRTGRRTRECECGKLVHDPPLDEPECACEKRAREARVVKVPTSCDGVDPPAAEAISDLR